MASLIAMILFGAGFNFFIDPFAVHHRLLIEGVNKEKPSLLTHTRTAKAFAPELKQAHALVLGTSRAQTGWPVRHSGLAPEGSKAYNLGLPGATMYEMLDYFQLAQAYGKVRRVVLALDWSLFYKPGKTLNKIAEELSPDTLPPPLSNFYGSVLKVRDTVFSLSAFSASVRTLFTQRGGNAFNYSFEGSTPPGYLEEDIRKLGHHLLFLEAERDILVRGRISQHVKNSRGSSVKKIHDESLRTLIQTCIKENIRLDLVINPYHARFMEAIRLKGDWESFENWKRKVADIIFEETGKASQHQVRFWDFASYNPITEEAPPPMGDKLGSMAYFWESNHFKSTLGHMMLDRIYNTSPMKKRRLTWFGVLLKPENLESHLASVRKGHLNYLKTHSKDVKELESIAVE